MKPASAIPPQPSHRRTISHCDEMLASSGGGLVCRPLALPGVTFTSCYIYAPRAEGWLAKASRELCDRVKSSDPLWLPRYAGFVYRSSLWDRYLAALFAPDAVLVPVPGSDCSGKAPWAALRLAVALSEVGFAQSIWRGLRRRYAVTKSATAPSAGRPTVQPGFCTHPHGGICEPDQVLRGFVSRRRPLGRWRCASRAIVPAQQSAYGNDTR